MGYAARLSKLVVCGLFNSLRRVQLMWPLIQAMTIKLNSLCYMQSFLLGSGRRPACCLKQFLI